jgi:hypothetical protein
MAGIVAVKVELLLLQTIHALFLLYGEQRPTNLEIWLSYELGVSPSISKDAEKMIKPIAVFLWRKIDHPGHDSCRLFKLTNGWRLTGAAIFWDNGMPCHLEYDIAADGAWKTRNAKVSGYVGKKAVDLRIASAGAARWQLNGVLGGVTGCVDVDLGFTPATNS